jgi:hypothetical protein
MAGSQGGSRGTALGDTGFMGNVVGAWAFRVEFAPGSGLFVGAATRAQPPDNAPHVFALRLSGGVVVGSGSRATLSDGGPTGIASGSVVGFRLDLPAAALYVEVDGAWCGCGGWVRAVGECVAVGVSVGLGVWEKEHVPSERRPGVR